MLGGLVAARYPLVISEDRATDLTAHLVVLHHPMLLAAALAATLAGSPLVMELIALVVVLGLLITRQLWPAVYLVAAVLVAFGIETAVKNLLVRPRPLLADPVAHAQGFSFPSGDTTGTAVLCVALLVLALPRLAAVARAALIAVGVFAIVAVAASRVLLGVHYPSDVLAGALLGSASALGLATLPTHHRARHRYK